MTVFFSIHSQRNPRELGLARGRVQSQMPAVTWPLGFQMLAHVLSLALESVQSRDTYASGYIEIMSIPNEALQKVGFSFFIRVQWTCLRILITWADQPLFDSWCKKLRLRLCLHSSRSMLSRLKSLLNNGIFVSSSWHRARCRPCHETQKSTKVSAKCKIPSPTMTPDMTGCSLLSTGIRPLIRSPLAGSSLAP